MVMQSLVRDTYRKVDFCPRILLLFLHFCDLTSERRLTSVPERPLEPPPLSGAVSTRSLNTEIRHCPRTTLGTTPFVGGYMYMYPYIYTYMCLVSRTRHQGRDPRREEGTTRGEGSPERGEDDTRGGVSHGVRTGDRGRVRFREDNEKWRPETANEKTRIQSKRAERSSKVEVTKS